MKFALIGVLMAASGVQANSLCGVTEDAIVLDAIKGAWVGTKSTLFVFDNASDIRQAEVLAVIYPDGRIAAGALSDGYAIGVDDRGLVYDHDHLNEILELTDADWIAEEIQAMACGPEQILQLSAVISLRGKELGSVTVLPFDRDRIVVIYNVTSLSRDGRRGWSQVQVALLERKRP